MLSPCSRRSFLRAGLSAAAGAAFLGVSGAHAASGPGGVPQSGGGGETATSLQARAGTLQFLDPAIAAQPERGLLARVRLVGDMHFGFTSQARLDAVTSDLAHLPSPDAFLTTGDDTHVGKPGEYDAAAAWVANWGLPFFTVSGNHTFWSDSFLRKETSDRLYGRFVERWGLPMPYAWNLAGVRFVCAGPTCAGNTTAEASLTTDQVAELGDMLGSAPATPTVLVLHSPLHHTVLGDGGPADSVYTSDDPGFSQDHSRAVLNLLAGLPHVFLVISGHTHSPLKANGLLTPILSGGRQLLHFNAMALPFVRRQAADGPRCQQDLVTWELGITRAGVVLRGRDHLAQRDVARAVVPLPQLPAAPIGRQNL